MKKVKVLTEREAEKFLIKNGFNVTKTVFISKESEINSALLKFNKRVVMKVSGEKIVHKTKVNGVRKNIFDYKKAVDVFRDLKKIKGFQGVLIQRQVKGEEFLLGLKKTKDFGYVVALAKGGSKVEKTKDVAFRVCGVEGVKEIINDVKAVMKLRSAQIHSLQKIIIDLCKLAKKKTNIKTLDINPLILEKNRAVIVDSQIELESKK